MHTISYILKKTIFSKEPFGLLILLAMAMPIAFSTWVALLNNFVIEASDFSGIEIGWLQGVREIPGFLAICVIFILFFISEQRLAYISLALLALAVAVTALFPSFQGLILTTLISSIGFHYYETVNQSLQLQWLEKETAPSSIGWIVAAGSGSAFFVYIAIIILWLNLNFNYFFIYFCAGALCLLLVVFSFFYYPHFETGKKQRLSIVLKRRYWVYYTLQFFSGARRQIFVVFASFMMVEKYGFDVHQITLLLLTNFLINIFMAPLIGRFIENFGERLSLIIEYFGLMVIFLLYAGLYYFDWSYLVASVLFIADHMFFGLAFAMKTYFQKIADAEDFAPTAAVAFTINHISAVFLPVLLGYIWIHNNSAVFYLAAILSFISLTVALLIPRFPSKGNESIL